MTRTALVYALHSGNLYGTERMAIHTAAALMDTFAPIILAPSGPAVATARVRGLEAFECNGRRELASRLRIILAQNRRLAFLATALTHSALCLAWNHLYRRRISHLHLVHGGAAERLSYQRKKLLNGKAVTLVAVSQYVRERLVAHGVLPRQVRVIENFLPAKQVASAAQRPPFGAEARRRIIVISRLDPEKRVEVLLQALEGAGDLAHLEVRVFGTGWDFSALQQRALKSRLKVAFLGFQPNTGSALADSDLLVHLCPTEPFGLAVLEAFAAGVPVLVPNTGGAASLVEDGLSGFHYEAGNGCDLARRLREILALDSECLNRVVGRARQTLQGRFSESERIAEYRQLLSEGAR